MKIILAFVLSLFLTGCQTIIKGIYGARKPAVQTAEGITRWLNKEGLQPYNLASVSPEVFIDMYMRYNFGPMVFAPDGRFLPFGYRNGKFCPQNLPEILAALKPLPRLPGTVAAYSSLFSSTAFNDGPGPDLNLQDLFGWLRTLEGEGIPFKPANVDYVLLVPFALSAGSRFQTKEMRSYVKALSQNPHSRFSIWFLNFDKQAWWGEEWNGKIVLQ